MQIPSGKGLRFVGTWELVPAESAFDVKPAPKSATCVVTAEKEGLTIAVDWVEADGKKGRIEHELAWDKPTLVLGLEHTLHAENDDTLTTVVTKDGAVVGKTTRTVSRDGKRMEYVQTGVLPNKSEYKNVSKYKKT